MIYRMSIREQITQKRPGIKSNTIDSYLTYLNKLYTLTGGEGKAPIDTAWLKDTSKVTGALSNYKSTTKKNFYNAIVVVLGATGAGAELITAYGGKRDREHQHYEDQVKSHKKTDRQEKNWVEMDEIDAILKRYKRRANEIYKKKHANPTKDFSVLQEYITLLTYRNIPMRNDVANMRVVTPLEYKHISPATREEHNYLVGSARVPFHFQINEYKTKKSFGKKKIDIPKVLNREIRKWLRVNKSGYFLTNSSRTEPISANGITKLLTKIFLEHTGKKVSTSLIRHIYLSAKYKDTVKTDKAKEKDAHNFGHSLSQQKDYIKE